MSSHGGRTANGIEEAVLILLLLPHSISTPSSVKNKKSGAMPSSFHVIMVWCLNTGTTLQNLYFHLSNLCAPLSFIHLFQSHCTAPIVRLPCSRQPVLYFHMVREIAGLSVFCWKHVMSRTTAHIWLLRVTFPFFSGDVTHIVLL
jgi:hypothetical protein